MPAARRAGQKGGGRGAKFTKLEDFARRVFAVALVASLFLLLYLLGGLWSGVWSHVQIKLLTHDRRQQQLDNIALVFHLLEGTSFVSLVSLLIFSAGVEGIGYWLLGVAAFFYAGASWLTTQLFWMRHQSASNVSGVILTDFQILGWMFAGPGLIWSVIDLARRFGEAAQLAAIQRATAKYGAGVHKQAPRQYPGQVSDLSPKARPLLVVQRRLHVRGAYCPSGHDFFGLEGKVGGSAEVSGSERSSQAAFA